jgi:hypothetical protein
LQKISNNNNTNWNKGIDIHACSWEV